MTNMTMNLACSLLILAYSPLRAWGQQDSLRAMNVKIFYTVPDPDHWQWSRAGQQKDWGYCRYTNTHNDATIVMLYQHLNTSSSLFTDSMRSDRKSFFVTDSLVEFPKDSTVAYSGVARRRVAFNVTRVVTGSSEQRPCSRSRMFEGFYESKIDSSISRRVLVIHFACKSVHVQILCDSPKGVYEILRSEMEDFVRSVRLEN